MASLRTVATTVAAVAASSVAFLLLGPPFAAFMAACIPCVYETVAPWLAPPYLYLLINAIILSIAASSRFHKPPPSTLADGAGASSVPPQPPELPAADVMVVPPLKYVSPTVLKAKLPQDAATAELYVEEKHAYDVPSGRVDCGETRAKLKDDVKETFISTSEFWPLKWNDSVEIPPESSPSTSEKPLVSVRFGGQRRIWRQSLDGKETLRRVEQPRRNETLESTWRAITEGRAVPLARHLKKSDTLGDANVRCDGDDDPSGVAADAASLAPRKCETFNDRWTTAGRPPPGSRISCIRRQPSPGLDELNRRVEAFIKRFNEEMRLQRQESLKQYMDMINRGT